VYIESGQPINTIVITNSEGQVMYSSSTPVLGVTIPVANWRAGSYFIKLNGGEVRTFVKE